MTTAAAVGALPWLKPGGPANIAPADVFMGLSMASCVLWATASRHALRFPYIVAMLFFLAGGTVGALVGPVAGHSAVAIVQDLWLYVWCWTVANLASSAGRLKVLLAAWAYSATAWATMLVVALAAGWSSLAGRSADEATRTTLTFGDPSYSASYYFISIMIIWATGYPRRRSVRMAAYAVLIVAILSTGSNSGLVSLTVGVAVATVLGVLQRRGPMPAIAVAAVLLAGGYLVASNVSVKEVQDSARTSQHGFLRDGIGRSGDSASLRDQLLHESLGLAKVGGPLGQGPGSTKPRLDAEMAPVVKEAHDDYLASLLERGLLGVLGLVVLLSSLTIRAVPLALARLTRGFGSIIARPNALVGAAAGTIIAMSVYELLHVRHVWALFGLLAAVSIWGRD